jgi:hypothetical protein
MAMVRLLFSFVTLILLAAGCKEKASVSVTEQTDSTEVMTDTLVKVPTLTMVWQTDTMLRTAESVLYDQANNILYVSNIGGVPPNKKDGDGYIAKLSPDGKIITEKWATGFDAPKGMGLLGTTLYVTDIDRIKAVDTRTGKTINTWKVPGATFLNDIATSADSVVYFTDSDKSAIHQLKKGRLSVVRIDTVLGGTNGVYVEGNHLYLAGYQSGIVFDMNLDDQSYQKVATDIPGGDGIERYKDGWIVSNWNGEIYHINKDGEVNKLLDTKADKINSADIEVIESQDLLLVPTFFGNRVVAYKLSL